MAREKKEWAAPMNDVDAQMPITENAEELNHSGLLKILTKSFDAIAKNSGQ